MGFCHSFPFVTFVVLTVDQFVGRGDGLPHFINERFSRYEVPTNSVAPSSVYKAYTTHNSSICSDEGLTLETSAFQSLYGGQFTLSTPLINQI